MLVIPSAILRVHVYNKSRQTHSINVRVRILSLAMLPQHLRRDFKQLADEFEKWVVGEMAEGELALGEVAGVGFAEDGVAVPREDLA